MRRIIQSPELTGSDVPAKGAGWDAIGPFALTFNGYEYRKDVGDLANGVLTAFRGEGSATLDGLSLDDLRACLFFEQRRCHHVGEAPGASAMKYIRALVEAIRIKLPK